MLILSSSSERKLTSSRSCILVNLLWYFSKATLAWRFQDIFLNPKHSKSGVKNIRGYLGIFPSIDSHSFDTTRVELHLSDAVTLIYSQAFNVIAGAAHVEKIFKMFDANNSGARPVLGVSSMTGCVTKDCST